MMNRPTRSLRFALAALSATALAGAGASSAAATTYCVNTTSAQHCSGTQKPDLQAALTAAAAVNGRDTVKVGDPGAPPSGGYVYTPADAAHNPVDIVGAGRNATTLTFTGPTAPVLTLHGDGSSVSSLKMLIPAASGGTGADLFGASARDVLVTSPGPQTQGLQGLIVQAGSAPTAPRTTIARSSVSFPTTGSGMQQPIITVVGTTFVDDTIVGQGGFGVLVSGAPSGYPNTSTVRRLRIAMVPSAGGVGYGMLIGSTTVNVDNIAIDVSGGTGTGYGLLVSSSGGSPATLNLNHASVEGNAPESASPTTSFGILESGNSAAATVNVRNSVFHDFFWGFTRSASGSGGSADIRFDYSDYDRVHRTESGPGTFTNGVGNIFDADPLWVNPAAGDFRLLPGSPVINRGAPNALNPASESLVDILFHPRISGGRRDMGAVEFQFPPKFSLSGGRFDKKTGKVRLKATCNQPATDRCRFDIKLKRKKTTLKLKGTAAGGKSTTLKARLKGKALKSARKHKSVKFAASGKVTQIAGAVAKVSGHVKLKRG